MSDPDARVTVGPKSNIQLATVSLLLVGIGSGAWYVGRSSADFETLKSIVYEIRADVKILGDQVRKLPQTR